MDTPSWSEVGEANAKACGEGEAFGRDMYGVEYALFEDIVTIFSFEFLVGIKRRNLWNSVPKMRILANDWWYWVVLAMFGQDEHAHA